MYKSITIFIIAIFFMSCASLPQYKSINELEFNKETIYSGYDSNSGMRWLVSNDSTNLYVRIDTDKPVTIQKIMNLGMKICIDTSLKKKNGMYINCPIYRTDELKQTDKHKLQGNNMSEQNLKLGIMLQKTSRTIKFVKNNKVYVYDAYDENADVMVKLNSDENGNMQYFAKIPFILISNINLTTLALGIIIEGFDIELQEKQKKNNNSNIFEGTNSIGKGRHSREDSSFEKQPELAKSVNIWFKVNLTN